MKQLTVPLVDARLDLTNLAGISNLLDGHRSHLINISPWPGFPSKPQVSFSVAHAGDFLLLKYYVTETAIRAANFEYNSPVYEDSCVEFFISFNDEVNYYNLEMNCIGTLLLGYGPGKDGRNFISEEVLRKIHRQSTLTRFADSNMVSWELTVVLPIFIFTYSSVTALSGSRCRANFYKCGDCLPEPHFLCWSEVKAGEPNFHLPQFFGELYFE